MTWRFGPDQTPPEPALVSPGLRTHLAAGTRDQVYAAIVRVADSDRDPRRRRLNIVTAAGLARRNPNLLGVDIDMVRAAARGDRADVATLLRRASLVTNGPAKAAIVVPAPQAAPPARRVVKVPKGAGVKTVRQARRARHTGTP